MRILFSILVVLFISSWSLADEKSAIEQKHTEELANQPTIDQLTREISVIAEKKSLKSSDKPALIQALKNVIALEEIDSSRDGTFLLSDSYIKNKKMYHSVLKEFSRDEQKTLKEIFKILERPESEGNG